MFERILLWVVFVAGLALAAWIPARSVFSQSAGQAPATVAAQPANAAGTDKQ